MLLTVNKFSHRRLLLAGCLFLLLPLSAQTVLLDTPEFYIGVSQGVNVSTVMFNPTVKQTPLIGYSGGAAFRYVNEKHFGVQAELLYTQRGWKEADGLYARRADYVQFPFLAHLYLGDTHRFIFNIGPDISYMLSETVIKNQTENTDQEQHIKPIKYPFSYGLSAGLGYNFKAPALGLFEFEVRAYYGLSDNFANTRADYFLNSNYLNGLVHLAWYYQLTGKNN